MCNFWHQLQILGGHLTPVTQASRATDPEAARNMVRKTSVEWCVHCSVEFRQKTERGEPCRATTKRKTKNAYDDIRAIISHNDLRPANCYSSKNRYWKSAYWNWCTGWSRNGTLFVRLIISSNIDQFSNFFHYENQENIFNSTVTEDPTTSQVCRYTFLWNICLKMS